MTQAIALENCQKKLADAKLDHLCQFIRGNHASIFEHLQPPQPYDAILFNLGYLPGSDHTCITTAENTLRALNTCDCLLADDGLLIITAYRGHPGGQAEAEAVAEWMREQKTQDCDSPWAVQQICPRQIQDGNVRNPNQSQTRSQTRRRPHLDRF